MKFNAIILSESEPLTTDLWIKPLYQTMDCCDDCGCPTKCFIGIDVLMFGSEGWQSLTGELRIHHCDDMTQMAGVISTLQGRIASLETTVSGLQSTITDLQSRLSTLESKVS